MLIGGLNQIPCMSFDEGNSQKTNANTNIWTKVLNYVQGNEYFSNDVSNFIDMQNIKKQIIKIFDENHNKYFVLENRNILINFLYESLIKPKIVEFGTTFKYHPKYKIYMSFVNSKEFYDELRTKYKVKENLQKQSTVISTKQSSKKHSGIIKDMNKMRFLNYCKSQNERQGFHINVIPQFSTLGSLRANDPKEKLKSLLKSSVNPEIVNFKYVPHANLRKNNKGFRDSISSKGSNSRSNSGLKHQATFLTNSYRFSKIITNSSSKVIKMKSTVDLSLAYNPHNGESEDKPKTIRKSPQPSHTELEGMHSPVKRTSPKSKFRTSIRLNNTMRDSKTSGSNELLASPNNAIEE